MKAYVGVTDRDWYRFLAARPGVREVNFWQPSGGRDFHVLTAGEPFFFKTHFPHNRVVGGGFFSGHARLQLSEAWELFGEANGAQTLHEMRERIGKYRRTTIAPTDDPVIGCIFVRDVNFFPPDTALVPPPEFARNIVQGKSYDLAAQPAASYFEQALQLLLGHDVEVDLSLPWHRAGPTYGDPRLAPRRLGQQSFQAVVLDRYHRRCAITGAKIRPVLQAAHIKPLSEGGEHRVDNGLLLRSDVHTLFDRGYLSIDPKHRLLVSGRLREEFQNGEEFYARHRQQILLPEHRIDQPNAEFLEWHVEERFLAS